MSINDSLSNMRSIARARAGESFEFFANHVCGLHVPAEVCAAVDAAMVEADLPSFEYPQHAAAAKSWLGLVNRGPWVAYPSELFEYIFGMEKAA